MVRLCPDVTGAAWVAFASRVHDYFKKPNFLSPFWGGHQLSFGIGLPARRTLD
jgi:hypothetical protein